MKARLLTLSLSLSLCAVLALPALAQDITKLPGYVDLDWIRIPDGAAEIQDIVLDPVLAGLAAGGGGVEDAALNQALAMVKSVRVKSFSLAEGQDESTVSADVKKLQERLTKDHWQRLIYMKEGEETVTVSTLHRGEDMVGLMLLTYEPGDSATFVNVVGDLDLTTLLRLATQMHGDELGGMLKGIDGGHGGHEGHAGHDKPEGNE
ncbi:MAG: DUF4252 domain-containing protein [bacterium]|nr:DUF4252 domain-containing protein [bacterium]